MRWTDTCTCGCRDSQHLGLGAGPCVSRACGCQGYSERPGCARRRPINAVLERQRFAAVFGSAFNSPMDRAYEKLVRGLEAH